MKTQHTVFAHHYIVDRNATQAAIRAGYAPDSAYNAGYRLMKNDDVVALIKELTMELNSKTMDYATRIRDELAKMAFANMEDYTTPDGRGGLEIDMTMTTRDMMAAVGEIKTVEDVSGRVTMTFKMTDKLKALRLLGDHIDVQAFNEQSSVNNKHSLEEMSDDELDAELARHGLSPDGTPL